MNLEKQLLNLVKTLGVDTFWIHKSLNEPNTTFPFIVINYISDEEMYYVDGNKYPKQGRLTFSIHSKTEAQLFDIKEELRDILLASTDFNFNENSGLTVFDEPTKSFGYQLDLNYTFLGSED